MSRPAHALTAHNVIEETSANAEDGLTSSEAKVRLDEFGRNELGDTGEIQPIKILIRQVANAMTLVSNKFSGSLFIANHLY
jgi:P-type Na+/K+ transporter